MYSTAEEVREMLKTDTLDALIGDAYIEDEREREAKIRPLILQAIQDADGEIDGYVAKRYTVPLPKPPGNIVKFSKDIAVYNLFSRIGIDEGTEQKNFLNRYNAAIKFLTLLAEGKVSLGIEGEGGTQAAAQTGFAVDSSPRLFSRSSMKGW